MKKRWIRNLEVSEIGMGCMGFSHGYGQIPPKEYSVQAIRLAYENGCTFFDTAEVYSPNLRGIGHNEKIVGEAIKPFRDKIVLATKLFISRNEIYYYGSLYEAVKHHLNESLKRLQTNWVDLYYLHRISDIPAEEIAAVMKRLIDEGLIKGWGMSQVDVDIIDRAQRI